MKKFFVGFLATLGGLVLFSFLALTFGLRYSVDQYPAIPSATVLTLNLKGPLPESGSEAGFSNFLSGNPFSLRDLVETLDQAGKDPRVKGLLFRVDHASLGIAQIQELHMAIKRFRKMGKFAFVHADTFGEVTPGTLPYYLASAFDEIALQPHGSLNFVGLGADLPFVRNFLNDMRVKPRFGRREEYKSVLETFTEETISEPNREATQALLDSLMGQIRRDIAQERDLREEEIQQLLAEAPLFETEKVKEMGFVDHIFYLDGFEKYTLEKAGDKATFMRLPKYMFASSREKNDELQASSDETQPKIALIYGVGDVSRTHSKNASPFMGGRLFGTEETLYAFQQAFRDDNVKAIVLRVNTPGGSPIASETIWRLIRQARDRGVPVVVSMSDMSASGGYWFATAANKIVAHPGTITGSIGVAGGKMVLSDFWEHFGIHWVPIQSDPNAQSMSPHHDFNDAQWRQLNQWLDHTYEAFLKKVSEGRNLSPKHTAEIAKGRVWTGAQAVKNGLVDELGDMNKAIDIAKELANLSSESSVMVEEFPRTKSILERFMDVLQLKSAFDDIEVSTPNGAMGDVFRDITALFEEFSRPPLAIRHPYKSFIGQ